MFTQSAREAINAAGDEAALPLILSWNDESNAPISRDTARAYFARLKAGGLARLRALAAPDVARLRDHSMMPTAVVTLPARAWRRIRAEEAHLAALGMAAEADAEIDVTFYSASRSA